MTFSFSLVLGFVILFVVLALFGNSGPESRSSNFDDDDDDSHRRIQDQMEEDNLYRLWQDSNY